MTGATLTKGMRTSNTSSSNSGVTIKATTKTRTTHSIRTDATHRITTDRTTIEETRKIMAGKTTIGGTRRTMADKTMTEEVLRTMELASKTIMEATTRVATTVQANKTTTRLRIIIKSTAMKVDGKVKRTQPKTHSAGILVSQAPTSYRLEVIKTLQLW